MHPLVNIAISAAKDAGDIIHKFSQQKERMTINEKSKNDFVTDVDVKVESSIIRAIHKAYPDHSIMAEEAGYIENKDTNTTWIIDPISGTSNFIQGYPSYVISIAVKQNNRIEHAVIFNPITLDIFSASRGQGARLNNQRLRVTKQNKIEKAMIGTHIPCQDPAFLTNHIEAFKNVSGHCAGIRQTGNPALELAYVAAGQLDGFWGFNLKPWQMAAGSLMIKESGGLVCDVLGAEDFLKTGKIVAGNPKILKLLLPLIK